MHRTVLFHRNFKRLTGGHLKVWDYFGHVQATKDHTARIHFTPDSTWQADNPWLPVKESVLTVWEPELADVWFLAGMDWNALTPEQRVHPPVPVINLIQGFHHANPSHRLYRFLQYPAVRICVSQGVADAIRATGRANGPVRTIENGIDLTAAPAQRPWHERKHDVLVYGHKWPALARELMERLPQNLRTSLQADFILRNELLTEFGDSRIAVCIGPEGRPGGFFLPALEAMAQGALVVTFDFIGNRGFCLPDKTCLLSDATVDGLRDAVLRGISMPASDRETILRNAALLAQQSFAKERSAFQHVLSELDALWLQTKRPGRG